VLSALIRRLGSGYSFLGPRIILWFFITSDVIATVTQVAGAALIGVRQSNREDPTTANNILLAGLAYQVFSITVFVILVASFFFRARNALRASRLAVFAFVFSIATIMIYLRTIFRLAETSEGLNGPFAVQRDILCMPRIRTSGIGCPLIRWLAPWAVRRLKGKSDARRELHS
jgi:uncharacterized membrane protein YozB (DUF420 family)